MKKFLIASASFFFAYNVNAQDCSGYYFMQSNKVIEMTIYNRKGNPEGRQVYTISDVKNSGGTTTSNFQSEMFDKKGKSVVKSSGSMQCKGGVMLVDMKMMLPQQQQEQFSKAEAKMENFYIEYPNDMKPGDALKDATMNLDVDANGMKQNVTMVVNNRKVVGKESVTTTAGTWECFKIAYKSRITVKTMGIGIPINIEGFEWYAPGFGIVKTESKQGGTAITAIK
jgi:hypothetical protein